MTRAARTDDQGRRDQARTGQPDWLEPELATLTRDRFSDPAWIFERKFDGERCLAFRAGRQLRLMTRNRQQVTSTYPEIADALRHQGIAEHAAGRLEAARERLEESVRLRREIGFMPGVAANLVGLAYIAAGQGRRHDALALIEEAAAIAAASGAHGITRHVEEARAQVLGDRQRLPARERAARA